MLSFWNKIFFHSFPLLFFFSIIITIWSLIDSNSTNKITIELDPKYQITQNIEQGTIFLKFSNEGNNSSINKEQNQTITKTTSTQDENQEQSFFNLKNILDILDNLDNLYILVMYILPFAFLIECIWANKCLPKLMYLSASIDEIKNADNEYITKCFIFSILVVPIIAIIDKIPSTHNIKIITIYLCFLIYIVLLLCFSQMPNIMMRILGYHLYRVKFKSGPSEYLLYSRKILNNKDDLKNLMIRPISPNEGIVDDERLYNNETKNFKKINLYALCLNTDNKPSIKLVLTSYECRTELKKILDNDIYNMFDKYQSTNYIQDYQKLDFKFSELFEDAFMNEINLSYFNNEIKNTHKILAYFFGSKESNYTFLFKLNVEQDKFISISPGRFNISFTAPIFDKISNNNQIKALQDNIIYINDDQLIYKDTSEVKPLVHILLTHNFNKEE